MKNTRTLFTSAVLTIALAAGGHLRADQPDKFTKPHEPFTAYGMQVRMAIINPINNSNADYETTVFQEIAPCRLTSTISLDAYASAWGGPSYQANESRRYMGRGYLGSETFVNPCSDAIPTKAIGLIARFSVTSTAGDGEIHIDSTNASRAEAATVLKFHKGQALMFEAGVLFAPDGSFDVATWYAGADVTIDVLGYLAPDPALTTGAQGPQGEKGDKGDKGETGISGTAGAQGPKGDTGARGDKGDTGAAGPQGAQGPKGDTGAIGAQGTQGPKGDTGSIGAQGPQGPKGDTGATGAQGTQGPKGDTGSIGAQGAQGPKGDTGSVGAQGAQGPKGDTGAVGAQGAQGPKGDTGLAGAQGPKGDTGAVGPQGANGAKGDAGARGDKGDKGDKGDNGAAGVAGPQGPMGPQGAQGPQGPQGNPGHDGLNGMTANKGGACYPPGNNANSVVSVQDASITANSIIMLNYTDADSKGQAQALVSQGAGHFETTGSPNTCFQYVVINVTP
jgi:hypothetical protein